eukprot:542774-Rhodomonas_salina.1
MDSTVRDHGQQGRTATRRGRTRSRGRRLSGPLPVFTVSALTLSCQCSRSQPSSCDASVHGLSIHAFFPAFAVHPSRFDASFHGLISHASSAHHRQCSRSQPSQFDISVHGRIPHASSTHPHQCSRSQPSRFPALMVPLHSTLRYLSTGHCVARA